MNWNWPGAISVTRPSAVQLLNGSDTFVLASTLNRAPTLLVKLNWKDPLLSRLASVRVVADQAPLAGPYSLALARSLEFRPPATSTLPLGSNVAVAPLRALFSEPVALHVPVAESYSSALDRSPLPYPPATSTLPLGSNVAVAPLRALFSEPVAFHVPVAGSYSSALARK